MVYTNNKLQSYLNLASTPWEDNQLGLVSLESLNVRLHTLK